MLLSTCQAPQPDKKEWNHDWKRRNKNQDRDHGGPGGIRQTCWAGPVCASSMDAAAN